MSIRIYALAKQLKVESKYLVEECKRLKIDGKGSALASLSEEEVELIKSSFQAKGRSSLDSSSQLSPTAPLQRPVQTAPVGKIPVIPPSKSTQRSKSGQSSPPVKTEPVQESTVHEPEESEQLQEEPSVEEAQKTDTETIHQADEKAPESEAETPAEVDDVSQEEDAEITAPEPETASQKNSSDKDVSEDSKSPAAIEKKTTVPADEIAGKETKKRKTKETSKPSKDEKKETQKLSKPQQDTAKTASPPAKTLPTPSQQLFIPPSMEPLVRPNLNHGTLDGKVPSLDSKRKRTIEVIKPSTPQKTSEPPKSGQKPETPTKSGSGRPTGPTIRLAPVPKPSNKPVKSPNEPAPQKPDMKLPKEAFRAAQMGASRPLTEHIRKHEEKRLAQESAKDKKGKGKKKPIRDIDAASPGSDIKKKETRKVRDRDGKLVDVVDTPDPRTAGAAAKKKTRSGVVSRRFVEGEVDESTFFHRQYRRQKRSGQSVNTAAPRKNDIVVQLPCTVKQYAEMTGLSVANVIRKLMEFGTPLMINSAIDKETAELLAVEFGLKVDVRDEVTLEHRLVDTVFEQEDTEESLRPRPPVVTFLGHVDHGKTSLLDRILNLDVVSGERGGITQHIRAYRVPTKYGQDVTFVDTPGHEAFTEMRARGANCTDIAVLVVAVDDGVMPQTEEAISHAKAAGVPIVVALNKMDLAGTNPDKAIQELAQNELMPSEWGGDTEIVRCSALTGMGIDDLMHTLLTIAELHELRANPDRPALGVALEAELQAGQGVVCKVLVQKGTLRTGDVILCGTAYGRVKAMYDTLDPKKVLHEASPSTPVNLVGLDIAPSAGSRFCVLEDISEARQIAEARTNEMRKVDLAEAQVNVTLENLFQRIKDVNEVRTLNIIIRADVRGSIEAIKKELGKLEHPEVKIRILQATVGGITEADVQLASASEAIIVGFNVVPDENARNLAENKHVQIRRYDIIYNLTADIKAALEGMLKPMEQVKELGRATVQRIFSISRLGTIAGCRVISGIIERNAKMRIIRNSRIIGEYVIDSLKREKDDAKEVRDGLECGIKLKGFNDLKEGDVLEAYKIEEVARTF